MFGASQITREVRAKCRTLIDLTVWTSCNATIRPFQRESHGALVFESISMASAIDKRSVGKRGTRGW